MKCQSGVGDSPGVFSRLVPYGHAYAGVFSLSPAGSQGDPGQSCAGRAAPASRAVLQAPKPAAHQLGARVELCQAVPSACCWSLSVLPKTHVPHAFKRIPSLKYFVLLNLIAKFLKLIPEKHLDSFCTVPARGNTKRPGHALVLLCWVTFQYWMYFV